MALSIPATTPSLSFSINLEPLIYRTADTEVPKLSVTATLDGTTQPITICIWHTILNIHQALGQKRFDIIDRSLNEAVPQTEKKNKRPAIKNQMGCPDERLFITLLPQIPYTVDSPFGPPAEKMELSDQSVIPKGVFGVRGLKKGKYTLRVSRDSPRCEIGWWRYGTKEENLRSADGVEINGSGSTPEAQTPLVIDSILIPPVEFEVV